MTPTRALASLGILLSGCATNPDNIEGRYVSPVIYASWTCDQLTEERTRVSREVTRVVGLQRENANADAALMTVGVVLLWPALLGLAATKDRKEEVGRLKGEYEAVDQAGKMRQCALPPPSVPTPDASAAIPNPPAIVPVSVPARQGGLVPGAAPAL